MKSEPDTFGINDLYNKPNRTEHWDGVRNYQARNMMRDDMKLGDQVFFYHSNCDVPGIVGIMEVVKEGYPDFSAFDPDDKHFDPKSDPEHPRWIMVDVKYVRTLSRTITLKELRLAWTQDDCMDAGGTTPRMEEVEQRMERLPRATQGAVAEAEQCRSNCRKHREAPADLALVRRGNRLSIMPVSKDQWEFILSLE